MMRVPIKPKPVLLLRVSKEAAEKIFKGECIFIYKRRIPVRKFQPIALIYATNPIKKIVGHVMIEKITRLPPREMWERTGAYGSMSMPIFFNHFRYRPFAYAYIIKNPVRKEADLQSIIGSEKLGGTIYIPYDKVKDYLKS